MYFQQKFACKDIRTISPNIGEGTYSHVSLCKIVRRGYPSRELYALKTAYFGELRRSECPVFTKNGRVKVRSGLFQLRRELRLLRMLRNASDHIVKLEYVKRSSDCILVFTKFAGCPIMHFSTPLQAYTASVVSSQRSGSVNTVFSDDAEVCLAQLALAVSHLHALGIVHKDIKPDNVLIRSPFPRWVQEHEMIQTESSYYHPHLTLCDFNVSEKAERIFDAQGTTMFSPPECFHPISKKRGIDGFARDVWSIGVLAWCLLCGVPPVIDPVPIRIQLALLCMETAPVLPNCVPTSRLRTVVESCLRLDPKARPSARQIRESLA